MLLIEITGLVAKTGIILSLHVRVPPVRGIVTITYFTTYMRAYKKGVGFSVGAFFHYEELCVSLIQVKSLDRCNLFSYELKA